MKINVIFIAAALVLSAACNGGNQQNENKERAEQEFKALPFPDVQVPSMISDQHEAYKYLAENYWNGITDPSRNFRCDSLYVSGVPQEVLEQKFANWTAVLDNVETGLAVKSVGRLYDRAYECEKRNSSSNVFETFVELAQKYLYDPNSPLRNEEYYLPFVSRYAAYEGLTDVEKGKYEREAHLCALNRIGTRAADFRFADRYGKIRNLYDIESELTLLFFSNPGCEACMNIINTLNGEPMISRLISEGRLAVLNIYIDEDIQAWRSYMPIYPDSWYNGFDPDYVLRGSDIYAIRAIPSLYLLDRDKKVIMKDAPENRLFNYLISYTDMESYQ